MDSTPRDADARQRLGIQMLTGALRPRGIRTIAADGRSRAPERRGQPHPRSAEDLQSMQRKEPSPSRTRPAKGVREHGSRSAPPGSSRGHQHRHTVPPPHDHRRRQPPSQYEPSAPPPREGGRQPRKLRQICGKRSSTVLPIPASARFVKRKRAHLISVPSRISRTPHDTSAESSRAADGRPGKTSQCWRIRIPPRSP